MAWSALQLQTLPGLGPHGRFWLAFLIWQIVTFFALGPPLDWSHKLIVLIGVGGPPGSIIVCGVQYLVPEMEVFSASF